MHHTHSYPAHTHILSFLKIENTIFAPVLSVYYQGGSFVGRRAVKTNILETYP